MKYLVGNWKMNCEAQEASDLLHVYKQLSGTTDNKVWAAVPACYFQQAARVLEGSNAQFGGQNVYSQAKGAFTGEISYGMLSSMGASFVLVGHSERRNVFGESREILKDKLRFLASSVTKTFTVILCTGETLEQHDDLEAVLTADLEFILSDLPANDQLSLIIAYEPIWAIGTGKVPVVADIKRAHALIKELAITYIPQERMLGVLYGGSVTDANCREILAEDLVDGVLVGGASIKADVWSRLVEVANS